MTPADAILRGRELRLGLIIRVRRHHRAKCASCARRRILFSIDASPVGIIGAESDRLCGECAGFGR